MIAERQASIGFAELAGVKLRIQGAGRARDNQWPFVSARHASR
ncbi:hypothetical protein AWB80_08463 [Caballeronia pedi]|uniref:Uncharacterized protein n=1 Tax=Caballeronia pedi TaxID=1777141 RepID=A0A158E800_9BURK|nr:hypothetical protein AWB80_08463 [Caballeronia pedi]